ncbi:MAG: protein phosphatase CheZ [Deltaproteobacteria bacterium]|nr:protein phosphatase CheZ [Deltaproteobacteria bacterium]
MENEAIKEILDVTRAVANGDFTSGVSPGFDGALAELASHIEKIRKNLLAIDSGLRQSSEALPDASGHLMDINTTLLCAAESLMTLIEKVTVSHERTAALLGGLSTWLDRLPDGKEGRAIVEELRSVNKETRGDLSEMFANISFQDLAGQKIKKMSGLIEGLETKVLEILIVFGRGKKMGEEKRSEMLKGLKSSSGALRQGVVDGLLKDFDL